MEAPKRKQHALAGVGLTWKREQRRRESEREKDIALLCESKGCAE